jgi:hypothetical protein
MELTPPAAVSSLLSHYQLQQIHASRNIEQDGTHTLGNHHHHPFLVKDKDKDHASINSSKEGSSPNNFPAVHRSYASSSLQSDNNHGNQEAQNLSQHEQQQLHGQHTIPDSSGVSTLQAQETSKFFMSSLLNLSSAPAHSSSESTLSYQGPGNIFKP